MAFADEAVFFRGWVGDGRVALTAAQNLVILSAVRAVSRAFDQNTAGIGDGADACEVVAMQVKDPSL